MPLLLIFLPSYLLAGYETLAEGAEKLLQGEALDEDFLMGIATLGALAIGFLPKAEPQFAEAVFVMLFYQIGELLEDVATDRSRRSIEALTRILPERTIVLRDGKELFVRPEEVKVGEIILVRQGDRIALDGRITEGVSALNTAAITGESLPRDVSDGDYVYSGSINVGGVLKIRVSRIYAESTASRIMDLVQNAALAKSRSERFISRFSRVYTPVVVGMAFLIAVLPPLLSVFLPVTYDASAAIWIYRALCFLIISCPCALVISVPLTFFAGLGAASKRGILIKGSNYLEALARLDALAFDKTGTLTEGVFEVSGVHQGIMDQKELLHLASHAEHNSIHPVAAALRKAYPCESDSCSVKDLEEIPGLGICAEVNGSRVLLGNAALMKRSGIELNGECRECDGSAAAVVHIAVDGRYAGHIVISDRIKEDAAEAVLLLGKAGIKRLIMLSGDSEKAAREVAERLGIKEYRAGLLPADKLDFVEALIKAGVRTAFVGDGINDAPVLARADVGIAMGALGSDAAIDAADVVLLGDRPSAVAEAIRLARRTLRIARQNIFFAIAFKAAVLVLAFLGIAPMWLAVFADVGVTLACVLNSGRALSA